MKLHVRLLLTLLLAAVGSLTSGRKALAQTDPKDRWWRRLITANTSPAQSIYQPTGETRSDDTWSETRRPAAPAHRTCPPLRLRLTEQIRRPPGAISAGAAAKRGVVGAGCRQ